MKHLIITRLRYVDTELMKLRAKLMKEILIHCLKLQTNQNFIFSIIMFDNDVEFVRELLEYDFISFEDYSFLKQYCIDNNINIQTRHDSDDHMSDDYIEKIQNEYDNIIKINDIFILQFQPEKINYRTGEQLSLPQYTNEFISGFITLCQSNVKYTVFEKSHTNMHLLTNNIYTYPTGYVKYYIHGKNDSLIPREERISQWKYNNGKYDK
mgnify:CR=1 FL=1